MSKIMFIMTQIDKIVSKIVRIEPENVKMAPKLAVKV